jgi:hypothetical protein
MTYALKYTSALRCIGQALENQNIDVFELRMGTDEFRVQGGDPDPPHLALIELRFSIEQLKFLDRKGQARRGQSNDGLRFDAIPEILRGVGGYIDSMNAHLRRIDNSCTAMCDGPVIEIEYETRTGIVRSENLTMRFVRDASVTMYKRRTQLSNPINMIARRS